MLLAPVPAMACSIALRFLDSVAPSDGATNVPLNAEVKFVRCQLVPFTVTLIDATGAPVVTTRSSRGLVDVLRPVALLMPDTRYTLTLTGSGETATATFTTGQTMDVTPPTLSGEPTVTAFNNKTSVNLLPSSCSFGKSESWTYTWPTLSDDVTPGADLMLEGMVAESEMFLGEVPDIAGQAGTLVIGTNRCRSFSTLEMATVVLRARAVDWAGNVSEPTEVLPVKNACGCSSGAPALLLLGVLAIVRRSPPR